MYLNPFADVKGFTAEGELRLLVQGGGGIELPEANAPPATWEQNDRGPVESSEAPGVEDGGHSV